MQALTAHVRGGRLVVDDATDLPEGTEVRLVLPDEGDDLENDDRDALHSALARGSADIAAGRTVDAEEYLNSLGELR